MRTKVKKTASNGSDAPSSGQSSAYAVAIRILSRRDLSCKDLHDRLKKREFPAQEIEEAIEQCVKLQYLDDSRYAAMLCRSMISQGRAVGFRLKLELKKRGLSAEVIDEAVATAEESLVVDDLIRSIYQRRYGDTDYQSCETAKKKRIMNYFVRRGFTISQVLTSINTSER